MKVLVVAPHPDDEILGPGGTLLRYKCEGNSIAWLIVTGISENYGWSAEKVSERNFEIEQVSRIFGFDEVYNLGFPAAKLDTLPMEDIVQKISEVIKSYTPDEVFIPHIGDVHTDHQVVHKATLSCTKSFRYSFINKILSYETLSETEYGLNTGDKFYPNVYVNITDYLEQKLKAIELYSSEFGSFPFPRSDKAIEALAHFRGASAGFFAAEAFQLLRERI